MQNSQQKGTVKMVEKIASINQVVNGFIWGVSRGIFEVFMDTIIICTLTGLVILLAAPGITYGQAAGVLNFWAVRN